MERQWLPSNFSEAPSLKRSMVELGSLTAVLYSALPRLSAVVLAVVATAGAAALLGLGWKIGALIGIVAMASDLLASFVKRRLGLPPSSQAIGLDQIPESLIPLLACRLLRPSRRSTSP
jgi:hypothetical protein